MSIALKSFSLTTLAKLAVILPTVIVFSGCGAGGPPKAEVYPVSGTVSGGSGDLTGCRVTFNPADPSGLSSSGVIGADGKYTLEATDGRSGCAAGKYKVTFAASQEAAKAAMMKAMSSGRPGQGGPPKVESPFPPKLMDFQQTDQIVDVKPESNTFDFAI